MRAGDKVGPYTLVRQIGKGGFGVVWLGEKRTSIATTRFALKLPKDDEIDRASIRQEAAVWVQASGHPNVLPIIEADLYDEQVVIVSEFAPDGSLSEWLSNNRSKAAFGEILELMGGILAGLDHLHTRPKPILHRDLKPQNVLLQGKTPRLADFGIARILRSTSQSSTVAGTLPYMAPEAFDGKRTVQTDIWSVGVMFYEMVSGRLPFPQGDMTELVGAIITREPDPLPSSVPKQLQRVIHKALDKKINSRYESAAEMRKEVWELHLRPWRVGGTENTTIKVPLDKFQRQDKAAGQANTVPFPPGLRTEPAHVSLTLAVDKPVVSSVTQNASAWPMAKIVCDILGILFLLVGIWGYAAPTLMGFHLTPAHNLVHLLSGAIALYLGISGSLEGAKWGCLVFGVVYLGLGILGMVFGDPAMNQMWHVGPLELGMADHGLHILLGAVFLPGGLFTKNP